MVNGISKQLKDAKKAIWRNFPLQCGTFSLFDIGHAFKEVLNFNSLNLVIIAKRPYDPNDVISNYIIGVIWPPWHYSQIQEINI